MRGQTDRVAREYATADPEGAQARCCYTKWCRTLGNGGKWNTAAAGACMVTGATLETVTDTRNGTVLLMVKASFRAAQLRPFGVIPGKVEARRASGCTAPCLARARSCIARAIAWHEKHKNVHCVRVAEPEKDEHGFR